MTNQRLTPDLLADPSLWTLRVRIAPGSLSALLVGPEGADRRVIGLSEPLTDPSLPTLENAIYDNPLLLSDFAAVNVVISTNQLALFPPEVDDNQAVSIAEDILLPDSEAARAPLFMEIPRYRLLALIDADTLNFLKRTFPDAKFQISLGVFANTLGNFRPADNRALLAVGEPGALSVCAYSPEGQLTFANRFEVTGPEDCAYYLLAVAGRLADTMTLGGDHDLRNLTIDRIHRAEPDAQVIPLSLPAPLLNLLRQAPDLPLELFLAEPL